MAAQNFYAGSYYSPAVSATNFPGIIERSYAVDLDLMVGQTDGTSLAVIEADDIIRFFKLPPNVKILYGVIESEALDVHATPTCVCDLQVTDGTTTKLIFDEATIVQAGGRADSRDAGAAGELSAFTSATAIGYVIPDGETDWYVALKFTAASATESGDGLRVSVGYTHLVENSEFDRDFPTPNP